MKGLRFSALVLTTLGLLGLTVHWSQRRAGFATPAACLDAYREASLAGDTEKYCRCLAEPLRAEIQREHPDPQQLAESLRRAMRGVKTWVQRLDFPPDQSTVQVDVDEVRIEGNRRIRFRLERSGAGWLIADIAAPEAIPAGIPYGTHVSKVPEGPQPAPQP